MVKPPPPPWSRRIQGCILSFRLKLGFVLDLDVTLMIEILNLVAKSPRNTFNPDLALKWT